MKKGLLVLLLAVALVMAFAATASANTVSGYITWNAGGNNAGTAGTPHKDYRLTTEKCAVCHAVHKGTNGGQLLLGDTVADACIFCHVTVGGAGNVIVYNGVEANYNGVNPTSTINSAHNAGTGGVSCSDCHAVHGANTITALTGGDADTLTDKILRMSPGGLSPEAGTPWTYATSTRQEAVSQFCSACHPYWVSGYNGTHTGTQFGTVDGGTYQGHVMTSTLSNPFAHVPPASAGATQVAFAASTYCRNCHDAGGIDQGTGVWNNNFPHLTDSVRFSNVASDAAATVETATSNVQDGHCLKCHRDGGGSGVGLTF